MFNSEKNNIQLNKYGKVIEEQDKTIVHVKQGIVYKYNNKVLPCEGLNNGKEVYYVFENINFPDRTYINGTNANLIFNNCAFVQLAKIERAKYIEMNNNKYTFYGFEKNCIELTADEILVKNNDLTNQSFAKKFDEPKVNIILIGDSINIEDSAICTEFSGYINILAQNLFIKESTIKGPEIYLNADNISTKKSVMVAFDEVKIDNKNCNFTCAIKSPITIYNNMKLDSTNSKIIEIDEEKAKLLQARLNLINTLHKVEVDCIRINYEELTVIREKLRSKKVCKVLKK